MVCEWFRLVYGGYEGVTVRVSMVVQELRAGSVGGWRGRCWLLGAEWHG